MLNRWQKTIVDALGNVQPYAALMIRRESDQALVTVYKDRDGTLSYPMGQVTADQNGYAYFYADADLYRITSSVPAIDWRDVDIGAAIAVGVANQADINAKAASSDHYGVIAPNEPLGGMTWADSSTGTLKRRNAANSAWVIEGRLFVAHMPIIPLADVPTSDIGPIYVIGVGNME